MGGKRKHIICTVPGCGKKHWGKGYCVKHYMQIRKHGRIMPNKIIHTTCSAPGCPNMHVAKGYCSKHYFQMRKYGKIRPDRVIRIGCKVPGCTGKHCSNGYCQKHHRQMRSKRVIGDRIFYTGCKVQGCKKEHFGKGYCAKHYHQIKKYGKIMPDRIIHTGCKVPGCPGKHTSKGYCIKHYAQILKHGSLRLEYERMRPNEITVRGKIAEITIKDKSKKMDFKVIIDTEDVKKAQEHRWFISSNPVIKIKTAVKKKFISLSRFIMGSPERQLVLYKNGNHFDCRKSNLVIGTNQQAIVNAKLSSNNTSGYKGVFWDRRVKLWVAYLSCGGTRHHAGYFKEKEKAIEARKRLEGLYQSHLKFFPEDSNEKIVPEL